MAVSANTRKGGWLETATIVIEALAIAMVVRTFLYQPFNIPSGSMKETLLIGDYLFVSKLSYGYSRYSFYNFIPFEGRIFPAEPKRGDVVVFKLPRDNSTDYIKRVVGLPGDQIDVRSGVLYINGQEVPRKYADVATTLPERRNVQAQHIEAVEQVNAEQAVFHGLLDGHVGRRDDARR